jgi:hypothetical protein
VATHFRDTERRSAEDGDLVGQSSNKYNDLIYKDSLLE